MWPRMQYDLSWCCRLHRGAWGRTNKFIPSNENMCTFDKSTLNLFLRVQSEVNIESGKGFSTLLNNDDDLTNKKSLKLTYCGLVMACGVINHGFEIRACFDAPANVFFRQQGPFEHIEMTFQWQHYTDAIMGAIASHITSLTIVYSTVYSDAVQRKHQSSASLAFVWGIHRGPANSPHKWPVTRKIFPFDDVIMRMEARVRKLDDIDKYLS